MNYSFCHSRTASFLRLKIRSTRLNNSDFVSILTFIVPKLLLMWLVRSCYYCIGKGTYAGIGTRIRTTVFLSANCSSSVIHVVCEAIASFNLEFHTFLQSFFFRFYWNGVYNVSKQNIDLSCSIVILKIPSNC